jgi:hypothetical protein
MIAKAAWLMLAYRETMTGETLHLAAGGKSPFDHLLAEEQAIKFFSEIIGADFSVFRKGIWGRLGLVAATTMEIALFRAMLFTDAVWSFFRKAKPTNRADFVEERVEKEEQGDREFPLSLNFFRYSFSAVIFASTGGLVFFILFADEALGRPTQGISTLVLAPTALLMGLVMQAVASSMPRRLVLRRIVRSRMKGKVSDDVFLAEIQINQECLRVLSVASVPVPGSPESELQETIGPHG